MIWDCVLFNSSLSLMLSRLHAQHFRGFGALGALSLYNGLKLCRRFYGVNIFTLVVKVFFQLIDSHRSPLIRCRGLKFSVMTSRDRNLQDFCVMSLLCSVQSDWIVGKVRAFDFSWSSVEFKPTISLIFFRAYSSGQLALRWLNLIYVMDISSKPRFLNIRFIYNFL